MTSISFIAIPKCASIATSHFCADNKIPVHWHTYRLKAWMEGTSERMKADEVLAIIRDPVDRVLSAYHYLKAGGRNKTDASDWGRYCAGFETFADFVEFGLEPAARNQLHFIPQWFWLFPPGRDVDASKLRLIRFDRLQEGVKEFAADRGLKYEGIPHKNQSNREGAIVNPEQEATIRQIYAKDLAILDQIK